MIGGAVDAPLAIEALGHVYAQHGVVRPLELHDHFLLLLLQVLQELVMDFLQPTLLISCRHASYLLLSCGSFVSLVRLDRFYHILN